jgi:amino acid transporter
MAVTTLQQPPAAAPQDAGPSKGLKIGAIGLFSTAVIALASTAPGYSIASAIQPIGGNAGVQTPVVMALAFVPMFFIAYAYKELNAVDPDCGTTFTWGTRAFGSTTGWMGGWAIVASDIIVMANLAQVAGQYTFSLFGLDGLANNVHWVTLLGCIWILGMTWIAWRGIQASARTQMVLFGIELVMLVVFAVTALAKVSSGHGIEGSIHPSWSWFNPFAISSFATMATALLTATFIYWGWDTAVSVNEETDDVSRTPGRAAVLSTVVLLLTYVLVSTGIVAYAGVGDKGYGLGNEANSGDALSILGSSVFGDHGFGKVLAKLLVLAILSSAAASAQTSIMPTARTTLSMAVWKALPSKLGEVHPRYQTPTWSTWAMGLLSIAFYAGLAFVQHGNLLLDLIDSIGLLIAFYYGLTGFTCVWYFRRSMHTPRQVLTRGVLPGAGGLILLALFVYGCFQYYPYSKGWSYTDIHGIGGIFVLGIGSLLLGVVLMLVWFAVAPSYFRKESTLLPRGVHVEAAHHGVAEEAIASLGAFVVDQGAPPEEE